MSTAKQGLKLSCCKCGCGQEVRYAYAPGHRPSVDCRRCGKTFSPTKPEFDMCSQCRRHVQSGGPIEKDLALMTSRAKQKSSPAGKRWCSGCERYRAVKFFGKSGSGYYSRCKPCAKSQGRASSLPRKYNITIQQYEEIKKVQGGVCAICNVATGASKSMAVDHDHSCCPAGGSCGSCVRGVLCASCNKMLGFARDSQEFFERAIEYLRNPPASRVIGRVKPDGQR
jgi:hypothetical protein